MKVHFPALGQSQKESFKKYGTFVLLFAAEVLQVGETLVVSPNETARVTAHEAWSLGHIYTATDVRRIPKEAAATTPTATPDAHELVSETPLAGRGQQTVHHADPLDL